MDTLHLSAPKPLMIAHRGCSALELENTAAAFTAAGRKTYWGIETDVHVTKDGQFIVIHDDTTGRVAMEDLPVEDTDLNTLLSLRLRNQEGGKSRPDQKLPTLPEYIRICKAYGKFSVLELKNPMQPRHIDGIIALIREEGWLDHTVFISFSLDNLIHLRARLPHQKAQLLIDSPIDGLLDILQRHHLDVDIYDQIADESLVRSIRAQGMEVNLWTVDTLEAARRFAAWGASYLTSNILE